MAFIKVQGVKYETLPENVVIRYGRDRVQIADTLDGSLAMYLSKPDNGQSFRYSDSVQFELQFSLNGWASPCLYDRLTVLLQTSRPFNLEIPEQVGTRRFALIRISETQYGTPMQGVYPPDGDSWVGALTIDGVEQASGFTVATNGVVTLDTAVPDGADVRLKFKWIPTVMVASMDMAPLDGVYGNRNIYGGTVTLSQLFNSNIQDPDRGYDPCLAEVLDPEASVIDDPGGAIPPTPCSGGVIVVGDPISISEEIIVLNHPTGSDVNGLFVDTSWLPTGHSIFGLEVVKAVGFHWPTNTPLDWGRQIDYRLEYWLEASVDPEKTYYTKTGNAGGFDLGTAFDTVETGTATFGGAVSPRFAQLHLPVLHHEQGLRVSLLATLNSGTTPGISNPAALEVRVTLNKILQEEQARDQRAKTAIQRTYTPSTEASRITSVALTDSYTQGLTAADTDPKRTSLYGGSVNVLINYAGPGDPPAYLKVNKFNVSLSHTISGNPDNTVSKSTTIYGPKNFTTTTDNNTAAAWLEPNSMLSFGALSARYDFAAQAQAVLERPGLDITTQSVGLTTEVEVLPVTGWREVVLRIYHGRAAALCPLAPDLLSDAALPNTAISTLPAELPGYPGYAGQAITQLLRQSTTGRVGGKTDVVTFPSALDDYMVIGVRISGQVKSVRAVTLQADWSPTGVFGWVLGSVGDSVAVPANLWTDFALGGPLNLLGYEPTGSVFQNIEMLLQSISGTGFARLFTSPDLLVSETCLIRGLRMIYYVAPRS